MLQPNLRSRRHRFEFVAYDTREFTTDQKGNPYLTYQEMQSVLSKSLLLYQNGHTGRIPRKVFVHKSTHFTEDETQGALDAFSGHTEVELIQVIRHSNWYGLKVDARRSQGQKPSPASYTVDRCLYLPMGPDECLLWTQGSALGINVERSGQPVFKEASLKPLADPILLRRFSGQGGWHDTCCGVLGLTKVDWNNNTLYKTNARDLGLFAAFRGRGKAGAADRGRRVRLSAFYVMRLVAIQLPRQ